MNIDKIWKGNGRKFVLAIVDQLLALNTILNFGMKEKERKYKRERLNIIAFVNCPSTKNINQYIDSKVHIQLKQDKAHTWPKQKKTEQTKSN